MNLNAMTSEQLEVAQQQLHRDMKQIKAQKRLIARELDQRAARTEAQALLAKASPAARQIIAGAGGIASGEAVGTPGTQSTR